MTIEEWLGKDNEFGIDIWKTKYQHNGETFEEWLERISGGFEAVKDLIRAKKFLFGGRILSNRGLNKEGTKVTYSNCYVISPPEDNIESIFECASKLARTYSYGGGCGIDISNLAPRGAKVNNTALETSGSVSFTDLYSMVTGLIGQNGRRGALMISISCDHPDLEEFISLKSDLTRVTQANISVRMTDEFMEDVRNDRMHTMKFVRPETGEEITKTVNARVIFRKLCEMNWNYAEPGILYWDNVCGNNMLSNDPEFEYAGTNPCAEEPLPAGGSCLLGSLNLSEFVISDGIFDWPGFKKAVHVAVHALNQVLDEGLPLHPLKEQQESVRDWRQIGLGIFGLADMLIKMGITYGSERSIKFCDRLGKTMAVEALRQSSWMAKTQGIVYPKCDPSLIGHSGFVMSNCKGSEYDELFDDICQYGLANSQLLTIAPTGSLSNLFGVSGGIEPIFDTHYIRKTESLHGKDEYHKIYTPIVKRYMEKNKIEDEKDLPGYFMTAKTIPYLSRLEMQATWQKHIDASISSTVNVPEDFTVEDTMELYFYAWELGCKGVTIFRENCARKPVLSKKEEPKESGPKRGEIIKASPNDIGLQRDLNTGCGTLHVEAYFDRDTGDLRQLYLSKGSTGGCNSYMVGLSRMISLAARGGISFEAIVDQLMSVVACPSYAVAAATKSDISKGKCCPTAVGYAIKEMHKDFMKLMAIFKNQENAEQQEEHNDPNDESVDRCPKCGAPVQHTGGCTNCTSCAWSKCD